MRPTVAYLRHILGIALAFVACGWLGHLVAIPPGNVTFLWLPAGIALAALFALGARYWPGVWLGALVVNLLVLSPRAGLVAGFGIAVTLATGAALQALLGAWWLRRSGGIFVDRASVFRFCGPIAFGSSALNATVGMVTLGATGLIPWAAAGWTWLTWWLGDATGVLVAAPFVLAWCRSPIASFQLRGALVRVLALALVSALVFLNTQGLALAFLPVPLMVWLSLRDGVRGAVTASVVLFACALAGASLGLGPFVGRGMQQTLLLFVAYVVVLTLTSLVLAVVEEQRRRAERASDELLATLKGTLQAIPDLLFILDREGRVVRWNRTFAETSAYPDDAIAGRDVVAFFPPSERPRVEAAMHEVYDQGYAALQANLQRDDGSLVPIDYTGAPMHGPEGEVVGMVGVGRDVRERKQLEDRLKESERRFRTVAMRVPAGIFVTEPDGACRFVNERWSFLTGLSPEQARKDAPCWRQALHPLDRDRVIAEWTAAEASRAEFSSEFRFLRSDGSFRWVYCSATPLEPNGEGQIGYIGTLIDLTERIETERLKLSFINAVSHDLRTPLSTITGFAEFLEDGLAGDLNPAQGEYLAQIQRGARRLEHLVDDLLDFATIEAGTFRLNVAPVDFGALLRDVAESLRPQAEEGRLTLELDLQPPSIPIALDCRRIERVLLNLIQNAIKFSPSGARITLRAALEGDRLRCEVIDRGRGIPEGDLSKLFRPFSQLEADNVKGGAGLGLSISKTIVEAHRGVIGVMSKVGEGSTFWFTLPLSAEQATAAPTAAAMLR